VKLRSDKEGRIACGEFFPPQTTFDVSKQPDGSFRLVELAERNAPRARLVRRNGRTYLESDKIITNEDVQRAMEEFP
jgi:hypothetical protein